MLKLATVRDFYMDRLKKGKQVDGFVPVRSVVALMVDSISIQYLVEATVDKLDDLMDTRFYRSRPNVATTCGYRSLFII